MPRPICFLSRLLWPPRFGGAELATHRLASLLGDRATLVCARRRASTLASYPYRVRPLPWPPPGGPLPESLKAPLTLASLGLAAPRGPHVWHAASASEARWATSLRDRQGGTAVASIHWLERLNRPEPEWPPIRSRSEARRQHLARQVRGELGACDAVIPVSTYESSLLEGHVADEKIRVIRNGLDHPRLVPPRPEGPVRFLCLGRMAPGKGIGVLLEAWRLARPRLPRARLDFAGDGDRRAIQGALDDRSLGVSYLGYVEGEAREAAFAASAAAVLPSDEPESWGLSGLEAMARGRPLIATGSGGTVEFAGEPGTGWLMRPGDVAALAEALVEAAEVAGSDRWDRCSARALAVARRFSWDRNLSELEELWAGLPWLEQGRRPPGGRT